MTENQSLLNLFKQAGIKEERGHFLCSYIGLLVQLHGQVQLRLEKDSEGFWFLVFTGQEEEEALRDAWRDTPEGALMAFRERDYNLQILENFRHAFSKAH